jgi:hypothetical protein
MGFYDRNRSLDIYRESILQDEEQRKVIELEKFRRAQQLSRANTDGELRGRLIDEELRQKHIRGEFVPQIGASIENRDSGSVAKVIGYDLVNGELRAVCVPAEGERNFRLPGIVLAGFKEWTRASKPGNDICYR